MNFDRDYVKTGADPHELAMVQDILNKCCNRAQLRYFRERINRKLETGVPI